MFQPAIKMNHYLLSHPGAHMFGCLLQVLPRLMASYVALEEGEGGLEGASGELQTVLVDGGLPGGGVRQEWSLRSQGGAH
jgi:hypothetical protein